MESTRRVRNSNRRIEAKLRESEAEIAALREARAEVAAGTALIPHEEVMRRAREHFGVE
jgi:hypothetical protein